MELVRPELQSQKEALRALLWRSGTGLEGRSGPGSGERRAVVNPWMLYGLPDRCPGAHATRATRYGETITVSIRALAALFRFQEKPEADCVNFLLGTNSILKPNGCGLGVKGGIQASSANLAVLLGLGASHRDSQPRMM